jgi:hypothetical protein
MGELETRSCVCSPQEPVMMTTPSGDAANFACPPLLDVFDSSSIVRFCITAYSKENQRNVGCGEAG